MPSSRTYTIRSVLHEDLIVRLSRAIDDVDGTAVVLKQVVDPSGAARLQGEFAVLRELAGTTGVVQARDLVELDGEATMVLDDDGGETLAAWSRRTQPGLEDILQIAIRLAETLGRVHAAEVVHRDIKPTNIVVTPSGSPILIDFGLATRMPRTIAEPVHPAALQGSLAYMAPEQTGRMNRTVDARCDLYALGATLYELVAGHPPFTTQDPAELVHAHIARVPVPLVELRPELPPVLSAIIDKLLAKDPEDRYRSGFGLAADLQRLLSALTAHEQPSFTPGADDIGGHLVLSERLVGRTAELASLGAALARTLEGAAEMALVTGPAGIGKSALIGELQRGLGARGFRLIGKFDPLRRDQPYSAVRDALVGLVQHVKSETTDEIARWSTAIQQAVGGALGALVHVLPELDALVGPQPPLAEVTPTAAKYRLQRAVQCLLRVFARPRSPVVLCLDDLQWADVASLDLIASLFSEPDLGSLLVVGTYRQNEVDAGHPLLAMLADLDKFGATITRVELAPLGPADVADIVGHALAQPADAVAPLAECVVAKTHGNPFFVGEFLRDAAARGLITFDPATRCWRWDVAALGVASFTDNVVAWMVERALAVEPGPRGILQVAACLGSTFDLNDLTAVIDAPRDTIEAALFAAGRSNLVVQAGSSGRFTHDRVHEAFLGTMDPEAQRAAHLRITRRLRERGQVGAADLFALVDHANAAAALVHAPDERLALAELNRQATRRARAAGAFAQAATYAACGIGFLPEDGWQRHYDLTFELHHRAADCEFVSGAHERASTLLAICLDHARSDLDRARVQASLTEAALHLQHLQEAIRHGREGLRLLGVELPEKATMVAILREVLCTRRLMNRYPLDELAKLPASNDERHWWILKLYYQVSGAIFQTDIKLMALVTMQATARSLQSGYTCFTAAQITSYGMIIGMATHDPRLMDRYGQVSLSLLERFPDRGVESVVKFLYGGIFAHWIRPHRRLIPLLQEAHQAGNDAGLLLYAGLSRSTITHTLFAVGAPLAHCRSAIEGSVYFAQRAKVPLASISSLDLDRIVSELRGDTPLNITAHHDETRQSQDSDRVLRLARTIYFRLFDEGLAAITEIDTSGLDHSLNISWIPVYYHFQRIIILTETYANSTVLTRTRNLAKIRISLAKLAKWAELNPANFGAMHLLASAEYRRTIGDHDHAAVFYEQAIQTAHTHQMLQHEALASELAGRHYLRRGLAKVADLYLAQARRAYRAWGADAVVARFDRDFPHLARLPAVDSSTRSSSQSTASLDVAALMKALAALSAEIHLDSLLGRLLHLALENAGAERGWLVLDRDGTWHVEASATADAPDRVDRTSVPWTQAPLPAAILHYAARTRESVVLDDAGQHGAFMHDAFVQSRRLRSVLCVPLVNQGRVLGLLYLENNLAAGVFTAERNQVLHFLAAQAAVSLEISLLYGKLEDYNRSLEARVDERTHALQRALDDLRQAQRHMVESEKMAALGGLVAGVAHEINTPVGVGVTAASSLADRTRELQRRYETGDMSREDLEQYLERAARSSQILLSNLGRAVELIQSFKQIAVDQSSEAPRTFRVREYLEHLLLSLRPELRRTPHGIELEGDPALTVQSHPGALSQIVTNLVMNSLVHAWPAADPPSVGRIRIEFSRQGDRLVLIYCDDGQGIAEVHLARIFEPFFTTRRDHGGSGLGLYIVYNLATQSLQGTIHCESDPGQGVRFTLTFPATFVEASASSAPERSEGPL